MLIERRQLFGEQCAKEIYGHYKTLQPQQVNAAIKMENTIAELIKEAIECKEEPILLEIGEAHKRWLSFYWPEYTPNAHIKFRTILEGTESWQSYYKELAGKRAAQVLSEALQLYCRL